MAAMRDAVAAALSNCGVAERIWEPEPNRSCADCGAPNPDWASINLCVVICDRCAGMGNPSRDPDPPYGFMGSLMGSAGSRSPRRGTSGFGTQRQQGAQPEDGQQGVERGADPGQPP